MKAISGKKTTAISFMLCSSQKTNERNENGFLSPDFEHHSQSADEIFKNKIVLNGLKGILIDTPWFFLGVSKIILDTLIKNLPGGDKLAIDYFKKNFSAMKPILESELISLMKLALGETEDYAVDIAKKYIKSVPKKEAMLYKPVFVKSIPFGSKIERIYIINKKYIETMDDATLKKNINAYFETYTNPSFDKLIRNHKSGYEEFTFIDRGKYIVKAFENFLRATSSKKKVVYKQEVPCSHLEQIKLGGNYYLNNLPKLTEEEKIGVANGNDIYKSLNHLNFYLQRKGKPLQFNGSSLALIIGSVWAYEAKIKNFAVDSENKYDYELEFTMYDHYSLDVGDFNGKGAKGFFTKHCKGFAAWYILQFFDKYEGCTPLIVKSTFSYRRNELLDRS